MVEGRFRISPIFSSWGLNVYSGNTLTQFVATGSISMVDSYNNVRLSAWNNGSEIWSKALQSGTTSQVWTRIFNGVDVGTIVNGSLIWECNNARPNSEVAGGGQVVTGRTDLTTQAFNIGTNTINSSTLVHDIVIFIRDLLLANVTDPASAGRPTNSKFVMTSYPERPSYYPLIIVSRNSNTDEIAGLVTTESRNKTVQIKIDIIALDTKTRDTLYDSVINILVTKTNGTDGTIAAGLHDFKEVGTTPIDEPGKEGLHRSVSIIQYLYYT